MMKIKVRLGDNDDRNYDKTVEIELSNVDVLILKDRMNTCSYDEYEAAWDRMCDQIGNTVRELPWDWFIQKVLF